MAQPAKQFLSRFRFTAQPQLLPGFRSRRPRPSRTRRQNLAANAIVLDGTSQLQNPLAFIEQLSRSRNLGSLPLVTLDPTTTQLANQVKGLSVFPCLATVVPEDSENSGTGLVASALWQVIQVAAGMSWKPSILFADISTLPDLHSHCWGEPDGRIGKLRSTDNCRDSPAQFPVFYSQLSSFDSVHPNRRISRVDRSVLDRSFAAVAISKR